MDETLAAYILTIEALPDRKREAAALLEVLDRMQVAAEAAVVPAIYWREEQRVLDYLARYPEHTFSEEALGSLSMGQLAATLSHISLWRRLLASDHAGALIFEDDLYVHDAEALLATVAAIRERSDLEFVRLHVQKHLREQLFADAGPLLVDDPAPYGFAAYYVSRSGAEKLLACACHMDKPVDWFPPRLRDEGELVSRCVTRLLVEHPPFEGDAAQLQQRHPYEREPHKLQKSPSAVIASPMIARRRAVVRQARTNLTLEAVRRDGHAVLRGAIDGASVRRARRLVLDHRDLLRNTRPTRSAGHLAGFHRYPELEELHQLITANPSVREFLSAAFGGHAMRSIGLSDITINRSQPWHKDLLRGRFRRHLGESALAWDGAGAGVYKVLVYLQPGDSLQIVRGSHLAPIPLDTDQHAEPGPTDEILSVGVQAGDIVIMDIRCTHRGSSEDAFSAGQHDANPKILVSTALGRDDHPLTHAMEIGNSERLADWMARHPASPGTDRSN